MRHRVTVFAALLLTASNVPVQKADLVFRYRADAWLVDDKDLPIGGTGRTDVLASPSKRQQQELLTTARVEAFQGDVKCRLTKDGRAEGCVIRANSLGKEADDRQAIIRFASLFRIDTRVQGRPVRKNRVVLEFSLSHGPLKPTSPECILTTFCGIPIPKV